MVRRILVVFAATLIAGLIVIAPSAFAAGANPEGDVASISCTAPGDCSAVTTFNDAIDYGHGILYTEADGKWNAGTVAQLPSNATRNPMEKYNFGFLPFDRFDGIGFLEFGNFEVGMIAVQCSSPGNCTAIGNYRATSDADRGVFFTEANGHWEPGVEAKAPLGAAKAKRGYRSEGPLTALTCTSAGNCTATGYYIADKDNQTPAIYKETNGTWSAGVAVAMPSNIASAKYSESTLTSVSCSGPGACIAVGSSFGFSDRSIPLIANKISGKWSVSIPTMPPNSVAAGVRDARGSEAEPGAELTSVSCPAAGDCTVAGNYTDNRFEQQPVVVMQTPTGWTTGSELTLPLTAATDAGDQYTNIAALNCSSADACSATGTFTDTEQNQQGLLLSETGGTWSTASAALPAGSDTAVSHQDAGFTGLSCINAGDCVAVGGYNADDSKHTMMAMTDDETSGTWAPASTVALPANAAATLRSEAEAVSCVAGSGSGPAVDGAACAISGGYTAIPGQWRGLAASSVGGVWQRGTEFKLPGVTHSELVDSLTTADSPRRGEALQFIQRDHYYEYYFESAQAGRFAVSWHMLVGGHEVLIGEVSKHFTSAGGHRVKMTFTKAGRKALKAAKVAKLTIKSSFRTNGGVVVKRTTHVTLKYNKRFKVFPIVEKATPSKA